MKYLYLLFFLSSFISLSAQCTVEAGDDIHICIGESSIDFPTLSPIVTNAVMPISVSWEYEYAIPNSTIVEHISAFIDDSTILNPTLTNRPLLEDIYINVFVEDNAGNTCMDSIRVSYSLFTTLLIDGVLIEQGDTTHIGLASSGFPPFSYVWTPDYNIGYTSSGSPIAWPDTTTKYIGVITDAKGCSYTQGTFEVVVIRNNTNTRDEKVLELGAIYPNPAQQYLYVQVPLSGLVNLQIHDVNGKLVETQKTEPWQDDFYKIDIDHLIPGQYIMTLFSPENGNYNAVKFIKVD